MRQAMPILTPFLLLAGFCRVGSGVVAAAGPPPRLPRDNLLLYRGPDGKPVPVKTAEDWAKRRAEVIRGMESVMGKLPGDENGQTEQTVTVRLDKALLDRCTALAKKKRLSRDALIARGLRALFAAEGE